MIKLTYLTKKRMILSRWLASGLAQLVLWFVSYKQGSATLAMAENIINKVN
ncbi:hypothetical protein GIX79_10465 [Lactobacillus reuteri]|uniref:Uncharacterized protein n=1 Tax=Limosilactobacillus reuteri TaxID=1598 RepID=A0AAW9U6J5_LIMRT|nr:hypothetical protein [Limosilactobacillus reuteri]MRG76132.1 hypothetical protein [Limosilactobacillus reuteri]